MAWKGLHLTRPARLFMCQAQLVICNDGDEIQVPLEDIAWVIIDNHQSTISVALLAACAEQGIVLLTSDEQHLPSALTIPFLKHHKTAGIAKIQLDAGIPLKKRIWQLLVRTKIENQAAVLDIMKIATPPPLRKMADRVGSGDPENLEAQAAKAYWRVLFDEFSRNNADDFRNSALNYGYAVLRGCLARAIAAAGFIPCIGIHHASNTNAFNLADDLIEPFRPIVDKLVAQQLGDRGTSDNLELEDRQILAGLPNQEVSIRGQLMTVLNASEMVAQSLVRSFQTRNHKCLVTPEIVLLNKEAKFDEE